MSIEFNASANVTFKYDTKYGRVIQYDINGKFDKIIACLNSQL
jgi:hypothetical protein